MLKQFLFIFLPVTIVLTPAVDAALGDTVPVAFSKACANDVYQSKVTPNKRGIVVRERWAIDADRFLTLTEAEAKTRILIGNRKKIAYENGKLTLLVTYTGRYKVEYTFSGFDKKKVMFIIAMAPGHDDNSPINMDEINHMQSFRCK